MWILGILIGFMFTGSLVADPEEDLRKCMENINLDDFDNMINKGVSEFNTLCTSMLNLIDCVEDVVVELTGLTFAEVIVKSPNPQLVKGATLLSSVRGVMSEVCTDGTELNRVYRENAVCLENMQLDEEGCASTALSSFEAYKEFEDKVQVEAGDDNRMDNQDCMVQAYRSACLGAQIHSECGRSAFNLYQEIVKRSSLFSVHLCTQKDMQTLKTKFLDSLDLEEAEKEVFRLAFDLRKRRK